jgi:lipopolysaccharide/colanic/teichoic acid biosynthesis glycosyltransferase
MPASGVRDVIAGMLGAVRRGAGPHPARATSIRLLDIYVAAVGLALVWPLLALVALLIRLESPGSPVFRQARVGRGGRLFSVYKFRTMRRDAPATVVTGESIDQFVFTPAGRDPRRTRLGSILRVTSMDEVLQLLNVLRGEMALVGPRPDLPEIVAQYPPHYHHRHDVPPGLTGLAQINGRSDLTYSETIAYDLHYVRRRTSALDLRILARTAGVVLRRTGAR